MVEEARDVGAGDRGIHAASTHAFEVIYPSRLPRWQRPLAVGLRLGNRRLAAWMRGPAGAGPGPLPPEPVVQPGSGGRGSFSRSLLPIPPSHRSGGTVGEMGVQ